MHYTASVDGCSPFYLYSHGVAEDRAQPVGEAEEPEGWVTPAPRTTPTQRLRVIFGLLYLILLLVAATLVGAPPGLTASGAWFWSGVLLVVLNTAVQEPYFPTPGDAIANSAALVLGAVVFSGSSPQQLGLNASQLRMGSTVVASYGVVVMSVAGIAIATQATRGSPLNQRPGVVFTNKLVRAVGSARALYSAAFLGASLAAFHRDVADLAVIWATWLLIIMIRPLEWLYANAPRRRLVTPSIEAATVVGLQNPSLVEISSLDPQALRLGEVFKYGAGEVEVIDRARSTSGAWALGALRTGLLPAIGAEVLLDGRESTPAVGYVEDGTTLAILRFASTSEQTGLAYGDLVQARVGASDVLYQVVDARVRTSQIEKAVGRSVVVVDAARLGAWDYGGRRFVPTQWLPNGGIPVRPLPVSSEPVSANAVGHVPGTSFAVGVDISVLITHSTAVLGVLGSGKSTFARELMLRAVKDARHVLVLDTSPEHAQSLGDFIGDMPTQIANEMNEKIASSAARSAQNQDLGGNRQAFRDAVADDIRRFLADDHRIRVYDLTKFVVMRQASWRDRSTGDAEFAECTLPELTATNG
ncbi:MAG: ATP-binding protein [Actinobacteria bacterium]|nr:ATP-binding protein [Actinomycetota bacterium]